MGSQAYKALCLFDNWEKQSSGVTFTIVALIVSLFVAVLGPIVEVLNTWRYELRAASG